MAKDRQISIFVFSMGYLEKNGKPFSNNYCWTGSVNMGWQQTQEGPPPIRNLVQGNLSLGTTSKLWTYIWFIQEDFQDDITDKMLSNPAREIKDVMIQEQTPYFLCLIRQIYWRKDTNMVYKSLRANMMQLWQGKTNLESPQNGKYLITGMWNGDRIANQAKVCNTNCAPNQPIFYG